MKKNTYKCRTCGNLVSLSTYRSATSEGWIALCDISRNCNWQTLVASTPAAALASSQTSGFSRDEAAA